MERDTSVDNGIRPPTDGATFQIEHHVDTTSVSHDSLSTLLDLQTNRERGSAYSSCPSRGDIGIDTE